MSLDKLKLLTMLASLVTGIALATTAYAQDDDDDDEVEEVEEDEGEEEDEEGEDEQPAAVPTDRFFADKVGEAEARGDAPNKSLLQGSLTSSTFVYRETGGDAAGGEAADNASPADRLYTDLRAQLDARHISGGSWDVRLDARARLASSCEFASNPVQTPNAETDCRVQSGIYGDNEYDVRELYAKRAGETFDLQIGRQYVLELAATKIDGVKFAYPQSDKLEILGFAGLHPARGSRSITEDYPTQDQPMEQRVIPLAAGVGGAYRYPSIYGSIGAVGILPRADEIDGGSEPLRLFVTSSGYWRQSRTFDLYHFAVFDVQGSAGTALTNLSLGATYRPSPTLRIFGAFNRVDTETLNVTAQSRLEDAGGGGALQNNIEVSRIASDAVRGGVSAGFRDQRFEISASGQYRRRPDITLDPGGGGVATVIETAQAFEVMLSAVDRRSFKNVRFGASVARSFSIGDETYARSDWTLVRLSGAREFRAGRGQFELDLSYLAASDKSGGQNCASLVVDPANCFGSTSVGTIGLGGTVFYRFKTDWFASGTFTAARQGFSTRQGTTETSQPANLLLTGFARIAYRF